MEEKAHGKESEEGRKEGAQESGEVGRPDTTLDPKRFGKSRRLFLRTAAQHVSL
jgi:hypothetical protein